MENIQKYYDYSSLSFAAYAENLGDNEGSNQAGLIGAGFTIEQLEQFFSDGWEVVNQSDDSLYGESSFSANLFHNSHTGEYVFANRGTAEPQDFCVDAWGITALGLAVFQIMGVRGGH